MLIKINGTSKCGICSLPFSDEPQSPPRKVETLKKVDFGVTKCGHAFHTRCLEQKLVETYGRCPSNLCGNRIDERDVKDLRVTHDHQRIKSVSSEFCSSFDRKAGITKVHLQGAAIEMYDDDAIMEGGGFDEDGRTVRRSSCQIM